MQCFLMLIFSKDFESKRVKIFLQLSMNKFIDIIWSSVSEKLDSAFARAVYSSNYPLSIKEKHSKNSFFMGFTFHIEFLRHMNSEIAFWVKSFSMHKKLIWITLN